MAQHPVEAADAAGEGTEELLLLSVSRLKNELTAGQQLGVSGTHRGDDGGDHLSQERAHKTDLATLVGRPPQDAAQHIRTATIARQHTISNKKSHGAGVVSDGAVLRQMGAVVRLIAAERRHHLGNDRDKEIGFVVGMDTLEHHRHAFEAHARINRRPRQGLHRRPVVLHKHIVPDLDIVRIVGVDAFRGHLRQIVAYVHRNLGTGAAGASLAHHPEIIFTPKAQHPARVGTLFNPETSGLFIGGHLGVARENRKPQALDRQGKLLGKQRPSQLNRLGLEVIAERKVAQHFKKSLVAWRRANLLQVIMLATDAQTLLGGGCTAVRALLKAQKGILELHHARIGEKQGRVVGDHQGRTRDNRMAVALEELQVALADRGGRQLLHNL